MSKTRLNWKKFRSLTALGVCGLVTVLSHQNCVAPSEMDSEDQVGIGISEPLPVTVIDDVKGDAALRFSSKSLQVHNEAQSAPLTGACSLSQEGAIFGWTVIDEQEGG